MQDKHDLCLSLPLALDLSGNQICKRKPSWQPDGMQHMRPKVVGDHVVKIRLHFLTLITQTGRMALGNMYTAI